MKIHLYSNMWNEEQFLPFFLRHYLEFVDHVFLYDHGSTDRSVEIAKSFGSKIEVRELPGNEIDERVYLSIYNEVYKTDSRGADWVMVADVDEIIHHPQIREVLGTLPQGWDVIKAHGFVVFGGEFAPAGCIGDAEWRGFPDGPYSKPCIWRPEVDIRFAPGRHYTKQYHLDTMGMVPGLALYHLKWLDVDRAFARRKMYRDRLSAYNHAHRYGEDLNYDDEAVYSQVMALRARAPIIVEKR